MQFLISVVDDVVETSEDSDASAVDAFNERLKQNGYWVFAEGLVAPREATVIDNRKRKGLVTDGPFLESKEFLGGLWIIDVPNRDLAMQLAAEGSLLCNRKVEVRAFADTSS